MFGQNQNNIIWLYSLILEGHERRIGELSGSCCGEFRVEDRMEGGDVGNNNCRLITTRPITFRTTIYHHHYCLQRMLFCAKSSPPIEWRSLPRSSVKVHCLPGLRDKKNSSFLRGRVEQLSVGCSFWRLPLVHPANANRTVGLLVNISVDEFLIYGCINFSSVNL